MLKEIRHHLSLVAFITICASISAQASTDKPCSMLSSECTIFTCKSDTGKEVEVVQKFAVFKESYITDLSTHIDLPYSGYSDSYQTNSKNPYTELFFGNQKEFDLHYDVVSPNGDIGPFINIQHVQATYNNEHMECTGSGMLNADAYGNPGGG